MLEIQRGFNLQLFAEEDGYSVDEAVNMLNGTATESTPDEVETVETEQVEKVEEAKEQAEEVEQEEVPVVEETPAVPDYTTKVRFKANGQEVEKSIQDLINDSQLASNYNRRMQEFAEKEKAFNATLQQQQAQQKESPADKLAKREQQIAEYAPQFQRDFGVEFNQFDPAHLLEMVEHYTAKREESKSKEIQQREIEAVENHYSATVQSLASDPKFNEINAFAEQTLFALPTKGADGVKEFQQIYGTYQKIQQRNQWQADMQMYGRSNVQVQPFAKGEVDALAKFYNDCKAEFSGAKVKEQVKAQVPKSVPIKPTVKVETTGNNDPTPPKKLDYKKLREMSRDEVAKLL